MYRDRRRICPGCARPMEAIPIAGDESTTVDRCPLCAGIFVEYFDRDPSSIARRMADTGSLDDSMRSDGGAVFGHAPARVFGFAPWPSSSLTVEECLFCRMVEPGREHPRSRRSVLDDQRLDGHRHLNAFLAEREAGW